MEHTIQAVNQRLDAFELRVLTRPAPTIDLTTLQEVVESLRADVENIMEMRGTEPETVRFKIEKDIVLATVFTAHTEPPPKPRSRAKIYLSSRTTEGEDSRARKKERKDLEASTRAFLIDEETHHIWARELSVWASRSRPETSERSTTDGEEIVVGTTEGGPTTHVVVSGKPNPHTC